VWQSPPGGAAAGDISRGIAAAALASSQAWLGLCLLGIFCSSGSSGSLVACCHEGDSSCLDAAVGVVAASAESGSDVAALLVISSSFDCETTVGRGTDAWSLRTDTITGGR